MRGNPAACMDWTSLCGSIPAYAGEPFSRSRNTARRTVYPRVCGGTRYASISGVLMSGLSPRMRGNRAVARCRRACPGSIPAYAGEPSPACRAYALSTVYPRVCGGTPLVATGNAAWHGLSPRMRGNPAARRGFCGQYRSIPAYAGEPFHTDLMSLHPTVYPRVCGGTGRPWLSAPNTSGLSPRMRGNLSPCDGRSAGQRSIPAYAGEPSLHCRQKAIPEVYPRVCGGTALTGWCRMLNDGLSPRMRGNRLPMPYGDCQCRSIPAYAGEPARMKECHLGARVYPRVCGGTCIQRPACSAMRGLSPRMRGNRQTMFLPVPKGRSIPAYAGEPEPGVPGLCFTKVYPRVCGGTPTAAKAPYSCDGLSPRMRGNRSSLAVGAEHVRSIPAYAGEPVRGVPAYLARAVYPRVCGGTSRRLARNIPPRGLSPRMRGNPAASRHTADQTRSIPAYAGEPALPPNPLAQPAVYPRVCGGTDTC